MPSTCAKPGRMCRPVRWMSRSGQTFISLLAALRQRLSQLDWVPVAEHEHTLILAGDFNAAEGLLLPERLQKA